MLDSDIVHSIRIDEIFLIDLLHSLLALNIRTSR